MRAWTYGAALESGVWGIRQPDASAPEVFPDILLVPLAAFDRRGHRIGYGAGYYDMTIARLKTMKPIVTIGVAFAAQEIPVVPDDAWDVPLDFVLTGHEVIDCRGL
jgi:5-formyltetrahydrofolate cyclo-ligase